MPYGPYLEDNYNVNTNDSNYNNENYHCNNNNYYYKINKVVII